MKGWWARRRTRGFMIVAFLAGLACASPGFAADSVEAFYKGKTLQLLIGFGPGGGYDLYGRAVARHMGRSYREIRPWCRKTWRGPGACGRPRTFTMRLPRMAPC
jgi:hypothetical protein